MVTQMARRRTRVPTQIQIGPRLTARKDRAMGLLPLVYPCPVCGEEYATAHDAIECEAGDRQALGDDTLIQR